MCYIRQLQTGSPTMVPCSQPLNVGVGGGSGEDVGSGGGGGGTDRRRRSGLTAVMQRPGITLVCSIYKLFFFFLFKIDVRSVSLIAAH